MKPRFQIHRVIAEGEARTEHRRRPSTQQAQSFPGAAVSRDSRAACGRTSMPHRLPLARTAIFALLIALGSVALFAQGPLAVTAIKFDPANPTQHDYIVFTATLTNTGAQRVEGAQISDAWLTVYCAGQLPCPDNKSSFKVSLSGYPFPDNPSLLHGESLSVKFKTKQFKPGTYEVVVGVGPDWYTFDPNATQSITLTVPPFKMDDMRNQPLSAHPAPAAVQPPKSVRVGNQKPPVAGVTPHTPPGTHAGSQSSLSAAPAAGLHPPATPMEPVSVLEKQGPGGRAITPMPPAQARKIPTPTVTPTHAMQRRKP